MATTMAKLTMSSKLTPFPYGALAIASYTKAAQPYFDETVIGLVLEHSGSRYDGEQQVIQVLSDVGGLSEDANTAKTYYALAQSIIALTSFPDIVAALDSLDDRLAFRTFLISHDITAPDFAVWGAFKANIKVLGLLKNNQHPHLLRWFNHIESLEPTQTALNSLVAAKANKARSNKSAAGFALGLQNAKQGQVVTRFPPEPSGYLHIGHAKAAILNQYFAKMYGGKLIIRFDDTNPSKEKMEFEETILEDLTLLDIHGDIVTHTSDYFDTLYELALKLIESGKAYTDDTEQLQMREERLKCIPSKHRDDAIESNLRNFAEMKAGSEAGLRWCLRAKISYDNPNGALRDPVIYRCNNLPHHRTGEKWKIYPTYDFACPVVDSIEGVTHALRTNEYRDRNPQYFWMIEALGLRPVEVWDFGRLSFIYTLLSKRKLRWFVDEGFVRGWDDPRFPTVRGIQRRGLTVKALHQFMMAQGPSQSIVSHEWDVIWTMNKKVIDPIAPRHWAIVKENSVPVRISGGPTEIEVKSLPKHKKNPEVGEKKTVYSSMILLDQVDALSFEDQEEITLMDWGNAIVRQKTVDASGTITSVEMDLNLAGDFRKTQKKITWLAQPSSAHPLVEVTLVDYDYLITKKKLEENDDVKDYVTPTTEFRVNAFGDAGVGELKRGDIIQFERRGYFIFDGEREGRFEFVSIPDGGAGSVASKYWMGGGAAGAVTKGHGVEQVKDEGKKKPSGMYDAPKIYGEDVKMDTKTMMYRVSNIYNS